jgi:DNA-binding XRE family transcriptional regulator
MKNQNALAVKLQEARKKAKLSQEEAAPLCDRSLAWYKQRESGWIQDADIERILKAIETMHKFSEMRKEILE